MEEVRLRIMVNYTIDDLTSSKYLTNPGTEEDSVTKQTKIFCEKLTSSTLTIDNKDSVRKYVSLVSSTSGPCLRSLRDF
jgi:hypothetical protein